MTNLTELLPENALLLDIETTGFQADFKSIYLMGCGFRKGSSIHVVLYYAPTPSEETEVLMAADRLSSGFSEIITFNGDMFDLPFIEKRARKNHVDQGICSLSSLDLYKIAKKNKRWLNLEHYNQKTLEHFFGIFREDKYNGGQLIDIYKKQAVSQNPREEALLFLHNMEDVRGMVYLLSILELEMLNTPEFSEISAELSNPKEILFRGYLRKETNLHIRRKTEYVFLQIDGAKVSAIVRPYEGTLKYYYPDYKNYVYIPDENLLLPKALAGTVDRSRQQKATRENCCTCKEGIFLPKVLPGDEKEFRADCKDKKCFVEIDPNSLSPRYLAEYVFASI